MSAALSGSTDECGGALGAVKDECGGALGAVKDIVETDANAQWEKVW